MDLTMFKYHDECGRIGFTENMYEKKDEILKILPSKTDIIRFNGFLKFLESKNENDDFSQVIYFTTKNRVKIICKLHPNNDYKTKPLMYNMSHRCPICAGNKKLTTFEYKEKIKNLPVICLDEYINNETPILHKCTKCGHEWKIRPASFLRNKPQSCPICSHKIQNENQRFKLDDVNKKLKEKEKSLICLIYKGMHDKSKFECLKCGHRWWAFSNNVINSNNGCPNCHSSSYETVISDWLTNHNIKFIREYKFQDCKNKNLLPFDFYIPKCNILIEMQGVQHFKPVKLRKTMSDEETEKWFRLRQRLDNIKSSYAKEMGYTFVEIKYNENIIQRLKDLFEYYN